MIHLEGTVLSGSNNVFEIECDDTDDDGNHIRRACSFKSKRLKVETKYYNPLAPGDRVQIEIEDSEDEKGQILSLVPRKNAFIRWNIKGRAPQLLAANLDYIILVTTPGEPEFRPRFIDRELVQAEYQNLTPIIVVNKYDLPEAQDPDFQNRLSIWEEIGYKVLRISAKTGEGLPELAELITGKLSALVGQSGIGKSSLVNVLDNSCVLKTGSLSKKYGKGSHTTTKGTLMHIHLNESIVGGVQNVYASIIDTPGVRRFVLNDIAADDLALYFPEMEKLVGSCKFGTNCKHESEPGCKILEAVEAGLISEERFESWQRIREEIKTGSWED
ncbi:MULTISPECIES: ribosome small subunit-dependent GTPase A [unclassified Treponema]|uniref:ribosome small subunit-dependent GTPase A n=1 Tax=unclassified Treponema TaxID=2638727 RepID=UPI001B213692|nr:MULTISPECIES: ribosome small subunit-dependent GTPase A [unclassified Treponema]MBO6220226.1 ribosome small subunit-dependent GTPase A [Treponema sp.]MBQ8679873.1 ribosome small subunit-dependent GTPase A [Treponema sp.]